MAEDDIVLNRELFKAIGADTRIAILKNLKERHKTQSELASELKLSVPTVLEHLDQLERAGLVQKLEEGRKWKYYKLTKNAEKLLSRQRVHAVVLLAIGLLATFGILLFMAQQNQPLAQAQPQLLEDREAAMITSAKAPASSADAQQGLAMETAIIPSEFDSLNETNQTKNETGQGVQN